MASEWNVFNTYVERELNNIEGWCETKGYECEPERLHDMLSKLMMASRRVTKYEMLVADQLELCPRKWRYPIDKDASMMAMKAHHQIPSVLIDFFQVKEHFANNRTRIAKAIKIIMALMAIGESQNSEKQLQLLSSLQKSEQKQREISESRNTKISVLVAVAGFFFPFTAVAAIMTIPNDKDGPHLGVGGENFWKFWVSSAVPSVAFLLAFAATFIPWKSLEIGGKAELRAKWLRYVPRPRRKAISGTVIESGDYIPHFMASSLEANRGFEMSEYSKRSSRETRRISHAS
jgi:hypothetical protein